jgi:hypothetical protein
MIRTAKRGLSSTNLFGGWLEKWFNANASLVRLCATIGQGPFAWICKMNAVEQMIATNSDVKESLVICQNNQGMRYAAVCCG